MIDRFDMILTMLLLHKKTFMIKLQNHVVDFQSILMKEDSASNVVYLIHFKFYPSSRVRIFYD